MRARYDFSDESAGEVSFCMFNLERPTLGASTASGAALQPNRGIGSCGKARAHAGPTHHTRRAIGLLHSLESAG